MPKRKNYNAGRDFEYKVRDYLRSKDWIVRRAYASKGMFDLIAFKDQIRWGIQCKSLKANNNKKYLTPKENKELCEYAIAPTVDYEFIEWKQSHHCPVLSIIKEEFTVIHAYNIFTKDDTHPTGIAWRINKKGEWRDLTV